jgi:alpha-L-rhamnosidase
LEKEGRALFREAFFRGSEIAVKTQTACALAIAMELLAGDDLETANQCLFQSLEKHNGYLSTGFVGTGYLCPALTKAGRPDLAVQLLLNEEHPSWLYAVNQGATTVWERWNSWTEEEGFGDVGMNSFNHYAFGSVCEWMFESLAGIKPGAPGFQALEVEPCLTDCFDYVKASFDSPRGRISIHWKKVGQGFEIELETPVLANVRLPNLTETVAPGRHVFRVVPDTDLVPA